MKVVHFTPSSEKYFLSIYHMPGTVLRTRAFLRQDGVRFSEDYRQQPTWQ